MEVSHLAILIQILFFLKINRVFGDLCLAKSGTKLESQLFEQSTPVGGSNAGTYLKDDNAKNLTTCAVSCCSTVNCNVVFLHNSVCFLIVCNVTHPELCQPQLRDGDKFKHTVMLVVRSVEETLALQLGSSTSSGDPSLSDSVQGFQTMNECNPHSVIHDCAENEVCDVQMFQTNVGYMCRCKDGFVYDANTQSCQFYATTLGSITASRSPSHPTTMSASRVRSSDLSCEVGLEHTCKAHEECQYTNSRARTGMCQCKQGFTRNARSNYCELITESHPPTTTVSATTVTSGHKTTLTTVQNTKSKKPLALQTIESTPVTSIVEKPKSTTQEPLKVEAIVVSAGDNQVIQLPENSVTLTAYTIPEDEQGDYNYHWSLISHPEGNEFGAMDGINTPKVKLSKLIEGDYTFKVTVTKEGGYGDSLVNVSVIPIARVNLPPTAVIRPADQEVHAPNDVLLDGSESSDDDKIIKYSWEQVSGPIGTQSIPEDDKTKATLVLKGLQPGGYRFKLTVTDSDDVENSAFANVTVIKEIDYPPKANAGSNQMLSLPVNSVTLYGNASTDDKGIVSYEWIKKSDKLTADMTGSVTQVLQLENLEVGDYVFQLKVTDKSGQTDTADVHVFVKAEENKPPVAVVGSEKTVLLPADTIVLDGSKSTDDVKITKYKWEQVGGHSNAVLDNSDRAVATASKLKLGQYKFKLTVTDEENLQGEASVTVVVKENQNKPPVADAGGDQRVHLPAHFVTLDGRKSSDDKGITSWLWTRASNSLAAGYIVNGSDHSPVLILSSLVVGRYVFTLQVKDVEGVTDTNTVHLYVDENLNQLNLVDIHLQEDISHFKQDQKVSLESQLSLLLGAPKDDTVTKVEIQEIEMDRISGQMVVTFLVLSVPSESKSSNSAAEKQSSAASGKKPQADASQVKVWSGPKVVAILRDRIQSHGILNFDILSVDTVVCQNNCSGHGTCDQTTKRCVCEAFWMENVLKAYVYSSQSNCDWSILYVIIVSFVIVVTISAVTWACICLIKKWYKSRPKKRVRYQLLQEAEDDRSSLEMLPKDGLIQKWRPYKKPKKELQGKEDFMTSFRSLFSDMKNKKASKHEHNGFGI